MNESLAGPIRILITGGGTGGHVTPALAVVESLRNSQIPCPIFLYVGSHNGIENKLAPAADIPFVSIATGKMRRSRSFAGLLSLENIRDALQVPLGIMQAMAHVAHFKPDVVFSTGGYVSVPTVVAAGMRRIPILCHEQTVQVGLSNRMTARYASKIALSFDSAEAYLSPATRKKSFVSGNPVRKIIFGGNSVEAETIFGFSPEDRPLPTLYVTGGAQGSHLLNLAVCDCLERICAVAKVIHQCGRQPAGEAQDEDSLRAAASKMPSQLRRRYAVRSFVGDEIQHVFAVADVVVGRSGAGTVAEVAALGKAAVYVPLVPTGGDEQTKNAERFVELGAAVIVRQSELNGPTLLNAILPLVENKAVRDDMGQRALDEAKPHAAETLADTLIALARTQ